MPDPHTPHRRAFLATTSWSRSQSPHVQSGLVRVVLATDNSVKRAWLTEALANCPVVLDRDSTPVSVEENAPTCEDNAILKARSIGPLEGTVVVAEDSGLFVDGLVGFPGTHTARWMKGNDDDRAKALIARCVGLRGSDRTAHFISVVVLLYPDGRVGTHNGALEGRIDARYDGSPGDGYGAIFRTVDGTQTRQLNTHVSSGDHRHQALTSAARSLDMFAHKTPLPHRSAPMPTTE